MNIDNTQSHLALKCNVFHYTDCVSNPQPIFDLLTVIDTVFQDVPLDGTITANHLFKPHPRKLKPTPRNWAKILDELRDGKISTLLYGSLAPNGYDWQIGIYFHLFNEISRQREPDTWRHYDSMGFWIESVLLQDDVVSLVTGIDIMSQAWEKLQGVYAFADMFVTHRTGIVSTKEEQDTAYAMKAKLGTYEVGSPRVNLLTSVPDAYWLNFLNATHTETLGGIEQIASALPTASVKSLKSTGMFIQISPSPIYSDIQTWEADHVALEKVLEPISFNYQKWLQDQ